MNRFNPKRYFNREPKGSGANKDECEYRITVSQLEGGRWTWTLQRAQNNVWIDLHRNYPSWDRMADTKWGARRLATRAAKKDAKKRRRTNRPPEEKRIVL